MLPFRVEIRAGTSVHEQVALAAKRAIVGGRLAPGDRFPSVRQLSQELKINPNTAHKVVASLVSAGILEVRPGIGTLVAAAAVPSAAERQSLLGENLERLVVEARSLSLDLDDVLDAVTRHWYSLTAGPGAPRTRTGEEDDS